MGSYQFQRQILWPVALSLAIGFTGCRAGINGVENQSATITNDRGNWNLEASPFPGEGYYSGLTSTIGPADVCVGKSIFGAAGARVCQTGTSSTVASASQIWAGQEAWDSSGNKVTGTLTAGGFLNSNALRDAGVAVESHLAGQTTSTQLTQGAEVATYAGAGATPDLPTSGGLNYRDIPDETKDDEGYLGTTVKYAPRPSSNCGTSGDISARIADCALANPTASTWSGATQGNRGQGTWKLVTRAAANKEVWRDERTQLLWSSSMGSINWCQASGVSTNNPISFYQSYNNAVGTPMTGNGTVGTMSGGASSLGETITITFTGATTVGVTSTGGAGGCGTGGTWSGGLTVTPGSTTTYTKAGVCSFTLTQGSTNFANNDKILLQSIASATYSCAAGAASGLQPAAPISYCAEAAGLNPPAGENWGAGTYSTAKGGMGANAVDKVRWRLPTIEDYKEADNNGLRFVLPDLGLAGASRPIPDGSVGSASYEWSASVNSNTRYYSWVFYGAYGNVSVTFRYSPFGVRCVGR